MSTTSAFDASIPVLTEVLRDTSKALPAAEMIPIIGPIPVLDQGEQLEALAREEWSDEQWHVLERRLSERILHQLQGRVDFVLEQRIKDSMAEVLQHALQELTNEIRNGLQQTIEKIVTRAVSQELTHLQTLKK